MLATCCPQVFLKLQRSTISNLLVTTSQPPRRMRMRMRVQRILFDYLAIIFFYRSHYGLIPKRESQRRRAQEWATSRAIRSPPSVSRFGIHPIPFRGKTPVRRPSPCRFLFLPRLEMFNSHVSFRSAIQQPQGATSVVFNASGRSLFLLLQR